MPQSRIFNVANMFFKATRENKILAKISEFTVIIAYHDEMPNAVASHLLL